MIVTRTGKAQENAQATNSDLALFSFRSNVNGKVGYIDASGKIIIAPRFSGKESYNPLDELFREFSEGFAGIRLGRDKYSYIDERGELITELQFDSIASFSEGFALVMVAEKVGFIDVTGKIAIPLLFHHAGSFSGGLAPACTTSNECGYINTTGKFVIDAQYEDADEFSEDLAAVKKNGKYGFIDHKRGKMVIDPRFGSADYFNEGLALVGKPNNEDGGEFPEGYINRKGKLVINTRVRNFTGSGSFSEGLAVIELRRKDKYWYSRYG